MISNRVLRFVLAGGVGFGVDAALLLALTSFMHWQALPARVVSFLGAVSVTWWINRHYAFADKRAVQSRATAAEYSRYVLTQSMGALINLTIFAWLLWLQPQWHAQLILPLAIASGCALFFNYFVMRSFVFTRRMLS